MKKVYDYWLPDSDNHFERLITKRVSNGGPPQYQDDVRDAAYPFVKNFKIAVDVGANVGFWARPLASKFDHVIAFEPIDHVYNCLELNVEGLSVTINKHALGSINSTVNMVFNNENTGASHVDETTMGAGSIEIKRLDDLDLPQFDLLKIDCERYDLEVLKGSIETILEYKPIIVVEQHHDTDLCAGNFLKENGAVQLDNVRKDYIFGW